MNLQPPKAIFAKFTSKHEHMRKYFFSPETNRFTWKIILSVKHSFESLKTTLLLTITSSDPANKERGHTVDQLDHGE